MPEEIQIETRPQPAYILCSLPDYFRLNKVLSEYKGYKIGDATERVQVMNPKAAKVNIQYDTEGNEVSSDALLVLPVSSEHQVTYPELFEGKELVSNYTPVDATLDFIEILSLETDEMFWIIEHCVRLNVTFDGLVLTLPIALLDSLTQEQIDAVNALQVTLIFE